MEKYKFSTQPPREALNYFRAKGIKPSFDYRDTWREEHATAFTVAKAMKIDILETIRDELDRSLAEGQTFQQFKNDLTPTLQKLGWWGRSEEADPSTGEVKEVQLGSPRRLKTIYQVNTRTARAAGQWQRAQRTKRSHPYLLYQLGPSREHRQEHVKWDGLLLPIDDPFWQTHMPINGYGCKCRVRQVSKREYDRLVKTSSYLTQAPTIKTRTWTNKRTGEVLQVPEGIDPGFDTNPGTVTREHYAAQIFGTKLKTARPEIGASSMKGAADFIRDGLEHNYRRWVTGLYQGKRQVTGEIQFVSTISIKVIHQMRKAGIDLGSAAILLKDKVIENLSASLSIEFLQSLTKRLANPRAVLLDRQARAMVYIVELDSETYSKVVISLERENKTKQNTSFKVTQINDIRTVGSEDLNEIQGGINNGHLQLLDGDL